VAAGLAFALVELLHMREMTNPLGIIVEAVLPFFGALLLFGIGLVLWTSRFGYEAWQVPRVVAWIAGGMAVMALVFLWLLTHQAIRGAHFHHAHFLGVNNLVVGGLAGFVVGSYDVRRKASQRTL
jgi:hypothetical protein